MATPSVPAGYAICSAVFSVIGASRNPTITCAVRNGGLASADDINVDWRTALTSASAPYTASNMANTHTLIETRVLSNFGGSLFSSLDITPIQGTNVDPAPPMNTAILVNKVTGLAGRKYRGRMFSPPFIAEGNVTAAGLIAAPQLVTIQSRWNTAYSLMITNDIEPRLLHADGTAPTLISSFAVSEKIGTIGRRLRR